jgi:hypothetical protein
VVVGYGTSTAARGRNDEAFRWKQSTGMQSIKGLLAASDVNTTGWSLTEATGVSAGGSVIVGSGAHGATLRPGQWLWRTLAWAHRLDGGKGADINGALIGLFGMTVPGASVAQDWAEVTAGIRVPAWTNGALTASVPADSATCHCRKLNPTSKWRRIG